jgi:hypothetical protein
MALLGDEARDAGFMRRGICGGDDRGLWDAVPEGARWDSGEAGQMVAKARAICDMCPVRTECLAYGIAGNEFGTWGGEYLVNGTIVKKSGRKPTRKVAA